VEDLTKKLETIKEGLKLGVNWTALNITLKSDCGEAIELIKKRH
jgi:hypothetical protein